ncbi:MAG: hypothetical protein CV089_11645 [Nitrospira sp. WS110]|nr:hypothetical protein [Nitrospira sp. WS110]
MVLTRSPKMEGAAQYGCEIRKKERSHCVAFERTADSFTMLDGLNIILKFCMGRLEATSLCWLAYGEGACAF